MPLAFGGTAPSCFARAARYGTGWTAGGASPQEVTGYFASAREAWQQAGREGAPRLWALAYFVLGTGGRETAAEYLTDYYGDWGPGMAAGIPADAEGIRATVAAFEATGADELILDPVSSDLAQLDLLAEALDGRLLRSIPSAVPESPLPTLTAAEVRSTQELIRR